MKKKIIVMATLLITVLIFNTSSFSQDKKYFAGLIGGVSLPVGNFSYGYKPGFNIEGRAGVKTSEHFAVGMDVSYNTFSFKEGYGVLSGGQNIIVSIKGLMVFKEFSSFSKVIPYATIAAGVNMNKRFSGETVWGNIYETDFYNSFAVDIGGGVSFKASEDFEIDLESKLNSSFDNPVGIFSVNFKAGVNYNF
ncbi:MAG: outer membrane beta-barrel protein [Ignavibacteria bacterium]|nr:outer membrane beta-barrel protein [Ignavibacteria bacterium]